MLQVIVRHHHDPLQAPKEWQKEVSIVHVANVICMMAGVGIGGDGLYHELNDKAVELAGLTNAELEKYYAHIPELLKQAKAIM